MSGGAPASQSGAVPRRRGEGRCGQGEPRHMARPAQHPRSGPAHRGSGHAGRRGGSCARRSSTPRRRQRRGRQLSTSTPCCASRGSASPRQAPRTGRSGSGPRGGHGKRLLFLLRVPVPRPALLHVPQTGQAPGVTPRGGYAGDFLAGVSLTWAKSCWSESQGPQACVQDTGAERAGCAVFAADSAEYDRRWGGACVRRSFQLPVFNGKSERKRKARRVMVRTR